MPKARLISRAHLPQLLAIVPLDELNDIVETHFGVRLEVNDNDEWAAIDSKILRGTTSADDKQGERALLAVTHTKRDILAQRPMSGPKSSEITAARELLRQAGLEKSKVTLDALHMNPTTTAQINLAGGIYIIQVKDNQEELRGQCERLVESYGLSEASPVPHANPIFGENRIGTIGVLARYRGQDRGRRHRREAAQSWREGRTLHPWSASYEGLLEHAHRDG